MNLDFSKIFDVILKIGSISGLVALLFTFSDRLKRRSKFKFDFRGSNGAKALRDNLEFYDIVFSGYVKNQSNEQNSITDIHYLIWANRGRTKTLTNGMGAAVFNANDNSMITLPMLFEAKEGKNLTIKFSVCLTGTHVKALVEARKPIQEGSPLTLPKYDFSLAFKDVNETLFDDKGQIRSQKLIDLWWTLPNTFNYLQNGNPFPYIWHMFKIFITYFTYKFFSTFQRIGF